METFKWAWTESRETVSILTLKAKNWMQLKCQFACSSSWRCLDKIADEWISFIQLTMTRENRSSLQLELFTGLYKCESCISLYSESSSKKIHYRSLKITQLPSPHSAVWLLHPVQIRVLTVQLGDRQCEDIMCPEGSAIVPTSLHQVHYMCFRFKMPWE